MTRMSGCVCPRHCSILKWSQSVRRPDSSEFRKWEIDLWLQKQCICSASCIVIYHITLRRLTVPRIFACMQSFANALQIFLNFFLFLQTCAPPCYSSSLHHVYCLDLIYKCPLPFPSPAYPFSSSCLCQLPLWLTNICPFPRSLISVTQCSLCCHCNVTPLLKSLWYHSFSHNPVLVCPISPSHPHAFPISVTSPFTSAPPLSLSQIPGWHAMWWERYCLYRSITLAVQDP